MISNLRCFLLFCTLVFFASTTFLCAYILTLENCALPRSSNFKSDETSDNKPLNRLAVLIPFRDRFDELLAFIPHMKHFLERQDISFDFFVLNQVDQLRFNRASLVNVGFHLAQKRYSYIVIHDVDLLPLWSELSYRYPQKGVFHVSSPELHPKYHYPTFLGGILIVRREDFEKVNGMSNRYWGWGLEDDELYTRLKDAQIEISRPPSQKVYNSLNTFLHTHSGIRRRRDTRKCFNQVAVTRRRDRVTGLHDVSYNVTSAVPVQIAGAALTVFNIVLNCDRKLTPWCSCDAT